MDREGRRERGREGVGRHPFGCGEVKKYDPTTTDRCDGGT